MKFVKHGLIILASNLFYLACFASGNLDQLTLDLDLSINKKTVQSSKIITELNQNSSVAQLSDKNNGTFIDVISKKSDNDTIEMSFEIGKIVNRKRQIISKPKIITHLDEKASVTLSSDNMDTITLAVIPSAKSVA